MRGISPYGYHLYKLLITTITSDLDDYAYQVCDALKSAGIRAKTDIRNEKIGYKIREHSNAKVPIIVAVGKKESEEKTVSVRRLGSQESRVIKLDEIIEALKNESKHTEVLNNANNVF